MTLASASADARVEEAYRYSNFGTSTTLRTDGSTDPDVETFVRFELSGLSFPIQSAKLRLWATSGTVNGPAVFKTAWTGSETSLSWSNRTSRTSSATDDKGSIASSSFVEFNLAPLITANGLNSFILATTSTDGVDFTSRETSTVSRRPQLLVVP